MKNKYFKPNKVEVKTKFHFVKVPDKYVGVSILIIFKMLESDTLHKDKSYDGPFLCCNYWNASQNAR